MDLYGEGGRGVCVGGVKREEERCRGSDSAGKGHGKRWRREERCVRVWYKKEGKVKRPHVRKGWLCERRRRE